MRFHCLKRQNRLFNDVIFFTVSISIIWILITSTTGDLSSSGEASYQNEVSGSSIATYLKEYIKPYLQIKSVNPTYRSALQELGGKTSMLAFIEDKIKSLMPLLDGGPSSENPAGAVRLDGEETTIVQFLDNSAQNKVVPRAVQDPFKDHIQKYKKLRNKISKALSKEPVSDKTKTLVTSTLDSMLAQLIGHECKWPNGPPVNRASPGHVMDSWTRMWGTIKEQYDKLLSEQQNHDEKQQFLGNLHEFFTHVYDDVKYLSQNYKVVCEFVQPNQKSRIPFFGFGTHVEKPNMHSRVDARTVVENELQNNKLDDKVTCQHFRVCYAEIKDFMFDLYTNLNETAVSTVNNYAAMYQKDVTEDSYHEKDKVTARLFKVSKLYEHKIHKSFRKHLTTFNLDPGRNRYANIKLINEFVSKNIHSAKTRGKKTLEKHLKLLRPKLIINIVKDIVVNMDVDLGNLERDTCEKICTMFETCNGKYVATRKSGNSFLNNKGVYVKVQLTMNDDEKAQLTRKLFAANATKTATISRRYNIVTRSLPYRDIIRTAPQIQRLFSKEPVKVNEIQSISNTEKSNLQTTPSTTYLVIYKK